LKRTRKPVITEKMKPHLALGGGGYS